MIGREMIVLACLMLILSIASAQKKPNFVVILTDDQGYDDYGFRQQPLKTPNMDRLMKRGVHFTRFYTQSSCAPTRAQLMTGRQFMKSGTTAVGFGGDAPHLDEYFLSEAMHDAGYATGMMGKWNLGTSDAELPKRKGFDEVWEVTKEDIRGTGKYDHYNAHFFRNGTYDGMKKGWQDEFVTNKAIDFIESHKKDPFFLYIPYSQPHGPWNCRKELKEKYMRQGIGESYATFLGMMEQLDTQVGRVLQALEKNELSDDTIVFFFGDNGPQSSTAILREMPNGSFVNNGRRYYMNATEWKARNPTGLKGQKGNSWENGIRNRLSVYCPAKFSRKRVRYPVTLSMDVYPTVLDLAGVKRKADAPPLDGTSLRPLLVEDYPSWPRKRRYFAGSPNMPEPHRADDGWWYRFTKNHSFPENKRSSALVEDNWVVLYESRKWGLFKINDDPQQNNNLKKTNRKQFDSMQQKFFAELQKIRKDPHAWSDPVQVLGLPGINEPYVDWSYIYRFRGQNYVTYHNTFFREVGAIQQLKIRVLKPATYKITLFAKKVPPGTKIELRAGMKKAYITLNGGKKNLHDLGEFAFEKGAQTMSMKVIKTGDNKELPKMKVYNLRLTKV